MLSIKEARMKAGLSQRELAEAMGVTRSAVSGWERTSAPCTKRIRRLADVLGCTVDDLLPQEQDAT